jgi:hypothetical protein
LNEFNNRLNHEKAAKLNANANTNVDVQTLVETYVLYTNVGKILIALIIRLTVTTIIFLIIRTVSKGTHSGYLLKAGDKIDEQIKRFDN